MGRALMKAIELVGDIDSEHRLLAQVPPDLPAGPVRLIVLLPEEDDAGTAVHVHLKGASLPRSSRYSVGGMPHVLRKAIENALGLV